MRKTWIKILIPILVLSLIGTGVFFAVTGNNTPLDTTFTYALNGEQAILTGSQEPLSGAVTLPQEIDGHVVGAIGDGAFRNCTDVTAFFIPDSVTKIGSYAFENCTGLLEAFLPEGLTKIGDGAFWKCESLLSVTIPISVTSVGNCAFYKCNALESLIVPGVNTPIAGIFNVALDIGQTLAMGNPARTVLDPIVTNVYCYRGSVAYKQALEDAYSTYTLLDDCTLTTYTVRYVDSSGDAVSAERTVALQPVGIEVAAVAIEALDDTLQYPDPAVQTLTLTEYDNVITFTYSPPEPVFVTPELIVREGSGAVIDRENGYIYGLEEGLSYNRLVNHYVDVQGDGTIRCSKSVWLGTGTKIQVIRDEDGGVEQTFTLIIFGDLNGDSYITVDDTIPLKALVNGVFPEADYPDMVYAGDMNLDGIVTMDDRFYIMGIFSGVIEQFDQTTRRIL